jgi:hypothetical protein
LTRNHLRLLAALFLVFALTAIAVACGDDDDDSAPTPTSPPATTTGGAEKTPTGAVSPTAPARTTTPTPEVNDAAGFKAALTTFNKELAAGSVDPLVARLKVVDYTCTAQDATPALGGPDCSAAGEKIRGFLSSSWRSEGGLRKVDSIVANLKERQAGFDTSKSDQYGAGTFRVYAFDPIRNTAVLTVTSKCLPEFQCPASGFQRLIWVASFEFIEGRWKIASLMSAFVLGEEFLSKGAEGSKIYLPNWEAFQ